LIPNVRRTWAPVGKTPVLRHSYRRDKISVIGILTISPAGRKLGLYARFHPNNISGLEVIAFLRHLLRHLRGHVFIIWDGGKIHRSAEVKGFLSKQPRLHVYRFPGYAPELNPIELIWTHGKRELSNGTHEDRSQLGSHLRRSLGRIRNSQKLLRACIKHSELPWP
jgi:putative transposase